MTVTEAPDETQIFSGPYDIGWSEDTAHLCMKYGDLFSEQSRHAGEPPVLDLDDLLAEHEELTTEILGAADDMIDVNYRAWQNIHEHSGVIAAEAREAIFQARREAIAGQVMIQAIASLHTPPAVETVTSVEVLPPLEPLPELEAATVSDDIPDDLPEPDGTDAK